MFGRSGKFFSYSIVDCIISSSRDLQHQDLLHNMFLDPPTSSVFFTVHNNGRPILPVWLDVRSQICNFIIDFVWNEINLGNAYCFCSHSIFLSNGFKSLNSQGFECFSWAKKEKLIFPDSRKQTAQTNYPLCHVKGWWTQTLLQLPWKFSASQAVADVIITWGLITLHWRIVGRKRIYCVSYSNTFVLSTIW